MYRVRDVDGEIVVFREETSIILSILMIFYVFVFLLEIVALISYITTYVVVDVLFLSVIVSEMIITLISIFVFNHLRRKGDMDRDHAVVKTIDGDTIIIVKKSSFWITLGMAVSILFLGLSVTSLIIGIYYVLSGDPSSIYLVGSGFTVLIFSLLIFLVLRFLRTKIDFVGERVRLETVDGRIIELYKSRPVWITILMIITLLTALILIIAGIALLTGMMNNLILGMNRGGGYLPYPRINETIIGLTLFIFGLLQLIPVAILNFLRVRGHVREIGRAPITFPPESKSVELEDNVIL